MYKLFYSIVIRLHVYEINNNKIKFKKSCFSDNNINDAIIK